MKRYFIVGVLLAVAAFVCGPIARAADQSVTGNLIDLKCNVSKPADPCHVDGATRGDPLTIHGQDGRNYKLQGPFTANKNAQLLALVGKRVTATGKVSIAGADRMLLVTAIVAAPK
jgi:hypothetical protein